MSLIARYFEAHGVPTVIMGCARDIVEHAGVPRFVVSDFPLGNSAGRPNDPASQRATLQLALELFDAAVAPRTTVVSPQRWADNDAWQNDFMNIDQLSGERIAELKNEFAEHKRIAGAIKQRS
ncbi:MAG: hypothetical protein VB948_13210 [Pseudomonadales bacterium]